jgi:hypothetical protein
MPIRCCTLALFALASCDSLDSDQGACPAQPLAAFCDSAPCPTSTAEAQKQLCLVASASFRIGRNDCGGETLESGFDLVGTIYHFAAAGQLVGADTWNDVVTPPGECRGGPYGRICHVMSETVTHPCSQDNAAADAGSQ